MWRVHPDGGCYNTRCLTGLCSTQTKVEGIVTNAAWHWGGECSVVEDPLGEPGRTPLYVRLLSAWGSVDRDIVFIPYLTGRLLLGDADRCK